MNTAFTILVLAPLAVPFAVALAWRSRSIKVIERVVAVASLVWLAASFVAVHAVSLGKTVEAAGGLLSLDPLGAYFMFTTALVAFFASMYSIGYLRAEVEKGIIGTRRVQQYFALFSLFIFAMFLALSAASPILMWVAIEGTTLSTAFLVSFYNKPSATEAAWKYLVLNSLGLLLGFLGTLLFLVAGDGGETWQALAESARSLDPLAAKVAFVLILVGYGTKVGFVPLHTWLPDAHGKAPPPVSGLLSGLLLNVALIAILRFRAIVDVSVDPSFTAGLLIFFGATSLTVAALIIFVQKNYKRLLAYSSIEHMGLMALGFAFGGAGVVAALLHMLYHALVKTLLFLTAGNIFLAYSSTKIRFVSDMLRALPLTSFAFIGAAMAIVGVPPFGTFGTKLTLLASGVESHPLIVVLALLALSLAFVGFLKHLSAMLFGEPQSEPPKRERSGLTLVAPLTLLALVFVISFFMPDSVMHLAESAASSLTVGTP